MANREPERSEGERGSVSMVQKGKIGQNPKIPKGTMLPNAPQALVAATKRFRERSERHNPSPGILKRSAEGEVARPSLRRFSGSRVGAEGATATETQ